MMREHVRAYHNFIVNTHAEDFYNNRWSSEVTRFLAVAIFGAYDESYIVQVAGFMEKDFLREKRYEGVWRMAPYGAYAVEE